MPADSRQKKLSIACLCTRRRKVIAFPFTLAPWRMPESLLLILLRVPARRFLAMPMEFDQVRLAAQLVSELSNVVRDHPHADAKPFCLFFPRELLIGRPTSSATWNSRSGTRVETAVDTVV